jgi:hypothetical protein
LTPLPQTLDDRAIREDGERRRKAVPLLDRRALRVQVSSGLMPDL